MSEESEFGYPKNAQIPVRTTKVLRDRLIAAAAANGRSLTQEVEHRLDRSFRDDDLVEVVKRMMPHGGER